MKKYIELFFILFAIFTSVVAIYRDIDLRSQIRTCEEEKQGMESRFQADYYECKNDLNFEEQTTYCKGVILDRNR